MKYLPGRLVTLLVSLILVLLVGCGSAESTTAREQQTADNSALATGEAVYVANCASCHGVNLEGQPDWKTPNEDGTWKAPPHDESGHTWHHPDSYIRERILNGTSDLDADMQQLSNMPAYAETLSDEEVTAVIDYIKSTWPDDIREMQSGQ